MSKHSASNYAICISLITTPNTFQPPSMGRLPDVVLKHLAPFLDWPSCRSLSQTNHRFRSHYVSLLKEGRALSIKGQMSVGVGDRDQNVSLSYLYEFYTVHVDMGDDMQVYWTLKHESGVRTIVQKKYNGANCTETSRSVLIPSRQYLEQLLEWILQRYHFRKIHLGIVSSLNIQLSNS